MLLFGYKANNEYIELCLTSIKKARAEKGTSIAEDSVILTFIQFNCTFHYKGLKYPRQQNNRLVIWKHVKKNKTTTIVTAIFGSPCLPHTGKLNNCYIVCMHYCGIQAALQADIYTNMIYYILKDTYSAITRLTLLAYNTGFFLSSSEGIYTGRNCIQKTELYQECLTF